MPYTTSVAGTTITASWANANVRDQVVNPFASTAARDAAITVPVAGMVAVTTDTNTVWTYSGTAWVQTAQNGAWTTWTPTLDQGGAVAATTNHAVYARWGRLIIASFRLTITGTGVASNAITLTIPITAARSQGIAGHGTVFDTSASLSYTGQADLVSTTQFRFSGHGQGVSPNALGFTGSAFTAALAVNDVVTASLFYEAAS